ncbi:hypothetical protein BK133_08520 [Paenibacillus sp. FSL H8-0548]|uniref:hypothetical protein n=1 Tax=Paenibacillus sp. FSL H8-0548 TaxID=1920422 RepID=UPI00096F507B|nr:hypothetical protein [Paenibacillus sp. FSL H8-0548]OMF36681.1 hypothetical protein BK133_08520 [Paenibacillus sp. FSL H8-0548]
MSGEKIVKEAKVTMSVSLIVGLVLLLVGLVFRQLDITLISNNKALIALSLLPLSLAFVSFLKLLRIKKSPQKMRSIIIKESDERLVTLNNEADAKTFKLLQGVLFLTYFGYTFIFPHEIFESAGWWILLILLLGSMILQGIYRHLLCENNSKHGMN